MSRSSRLYVRASAVMPGGVNAPERAFVLVGGNPPFIARGEGAEMVDEEGHRFLDLMCAGGALVFGHASHRILGAVTAAVARGALFGAPTEGEVLLAEAIVRRVPSVDRVRLFNSSTEAAIQAVRASRALTGRERIVVMEGSCHGGHDLAAVARGDLTGVPAALADTVVVVPYNDLDAVGEVMERIGDQIAAVLVEPVASRMGCIAPVQGYLQGLRDLTRERGSLLVYDETTTGFRLGAGGAQERFGVLPDLTCLGKILGGGFPLAAVGGSAQVMDLASAVLRAGPQCASPVALAAGLATLEALDAEIYQQLEAAGQTLEEELAGALSYHGCSLGRVGSMFTVFYRETLPRNAAEARECDIDAFESFHCAALGGGVYLPPGQLETAFLPVVLGDRQLAMAIEGITAAMVAAEA